ncbi:MAG: pyridoxal phosphate-dependent aminotransferase [Bryobacteraceae bacterium]
MFSSRLNWQAHPNALSRLLAARRVAGQTVADLTQSNPTQAGFEYRGAGISRALADTRSLVYEPAASGMAPARNGVAGYYAERGVTVSADDIVLTASTSEAYSYLFKLLCNPGDEVLAPVPSYPLFEYLAALECVRAVSYPLAFANGWFIDFDMLLRQVSPRTRAVVIVNPNNPTGSFLKKTEWAQLREICVENHLAIISDEVFADFAFADDPQRQWTVAGSDGPLAFALSGLSKIAGLPQMKLGWIAAGGRQDLVRDAVSRLELIADTFLSVSTPVQHALPALFPVGNSVRRQIRERCARNLARLGDTLPRTTGAEVLPVEGGWYATIQVPRVRTEEEWAQVLLERHGVLVQPGYFYDFPREAYLIVSLLTHPEVFDQGLRALAAEVGETRVPM